MNTDLIGIFPSLVSNARYCAVPRQQYPAASREQCCQHGCSSIKLCYYSIVQLSILLLLLNRVKQQCNDNNSEQAFYCFPLFQQPWTTVVASSMLNNNEQHCSFTNIVQSAFVCTTLNSSYISLQREWVRCLSLLYRTHPRKEAKSTLFTKEYLV